MEERLELLLKTLNLSPAQFADEIGLKRSGIYHIMKGRNKPGMEFFIRVLERYPDISIDWLLTGKGAMKKSRQLSMVEEPAVSSPAQKPAPLSEKRTGKETSQRETKKKATGTVSFKEEGDPTSIQKIVIFYADGTFSEFAPR